MQAYLKQLSDAALLGTDKRDLPATPEVVTGLVSVELEKESQLLTAAGVASLYIKGASEAQREGRLLPEPAPVETQELMSSAASAYLVKFLKGQDEVANQQALLAEGLAALSASGRRVEHRYLPALLDLGNAGKSLRASVGAIMGQRGAWLARQNPSWNYAIRTEDHKASFETGQAAERTHALTQLRKENPAEALALLEQSWKSEAAKERTAFIDCLQEGLSLTDEAFLEVALDDKSKNVRERSAAFLSTLPESALTKRMIERAKALLTYQAGGMMGLKKAKLELSLPEGLDDTAERDGLEWRKASKTKGQKAYLFEQIMSRVPLGTWSADLRQMVAACPKTERDLLLGSLVGACKRFKDATHAASLLALEKNYDSVASLAPLLNHEQAAELAYKMLVALPKLSYEHPFMDLIQANALTWNPALKRQFMKVFKTSFAAWKDNWRVRPILGILARSLPVEFHADLADLAPQDPQHVLFDTYRNFLATLVFREKMLKAFAHD